jgi:hypothetical protein
MKINVKRIPVDGESLTGSEPASIMELDEPDVRFVHEVRYDFFAQVRATRCWLLELHTPATLRSCV